MTQKKRSFKQNIYCTKNTNIKKNKYNTQLQQLCNRTGALGSISIALPDTFGGLRKGDLTWWDCSDLRDEPALQGTYNSFNDSRSDLYNDWLLNRQVLKKYNSSG